MMWSRCNYRFRISLVNGLPRHAARMLAALMLSISLIACGAPDTAVPSPTSAPARLAAALPVSATVGTAQVPNDGDAADDPAIWVHPGNPALSTVISTD